MVQVKQQLEQCLSKFRNGKLTEQDLQQALESANSQIQAETKCQRLLYLQAENTLVTSKVEGMSIVDRDGVHHGPDNPHDWPYQTVHEAMRDGWHVIKFPEMALMMASDDKTYGLGCDFILEK